MKFLISNKKLSTGIFLLIGVFANLVDAPRVFAETTVLYESYEQGGEITTNVAGGNGTLIGTFTPETNLFFDNNSGVYVGISWKNETIVCHASPHFSVGVASSTTAYSNTALWATKDYFHSHDQYAFDEMTSDSGSPGVQLIAGHTYGIYAFPNCGGGVNMKIRADSSNLIYYGYLSWDGNYGPSFSEISGRTRIISVVPVDDAVVSTSTPVTLSADIFVNESDFDEDMYLRFRYVRQQNLQTAVACIECLYTNIDVPISTANGSTISEDTSGILTGGEYLYTVEIRNPSLLHNILGWWGLGNLYDPGMLAESHTSFIVGERTALDEFIFEMASTTQALLTDPGIFEDIQDNCNPISGFDALGCLVALFIPNNAQLSTSMNTSKEYVLTKAPLGYVTRTVSILSNSATTSLPNISYTFGTGSPLEGEEFSFNYTQIVADADQILTEDWVSNQEDPQNIWDIFMPLWEVLVYAFLLVMILKEVTGIGTQHHSHGDSKDKYSKRQ